MKKMMFTLMAFLTIAVNASAMSYEQAREEALFLTDKMAYELNLTDAQYEAAYEINLDYLMGVTSEYDVYGPYWERRNLDLSYILFSWQWDLYRAAHYFYRPLFWERGYWHFGIYARYPHRDYFYFGRPHFYNTYRGGHSWRMNNGRSFYEGRRDFYRPGHVTRDTHFGMRSGWDRGDYRPQPGGGRNSSTRITGGGPGNPPAGNGNRGSFGNGNRGSFGNGNPGVGSGNRGSFGNGNPGGGPGNRGSFGNGNTGGGPGNRGNYDGGSGNRGSFGSGNPGGGPGNNGGGAGPGTRGSFGSGNPGGGSGSFGGSRSSGSFGGTRSTGGSVGGSTPSTGSRSSGSFGGGRSTGGSVGGGATRGGGAGGGGHRGGFGGSRR